MSLALITLLTLIAGGPDLTNIHTLSDKRSVLASVVEMPVADVKSITISGTDKKKSFTAKIYLSIEELSNKLIINIGINDENIVNTYVDLEMMGTSNLDLSSSRLYLRQFEDEREIRLIIKYGEKNNCFLNSDGRSEFDIYINSTGTREVSIDTIENCEIQTPKYFDIL